MAADTGAIVVAHWAEHLAWAFQIWALGRPVKDDPLTVVLLVADLALLVLAVVSARRPPDSS
ncbi:hypothetical protein [Micromonospora sp. DT229]|uniref:hypothetical protein n=1 Tax=Micromonospora sp. DT229 TaxID=3393430 RepID=UPI003CEF3129